MQIASPSASDDLASLPFVQRWKRAGSALGAVMTDPDDTEKVLELLTLVNGGWWARVRIARFLATPGGRKLYEEHRTIDTRTVDLDALAALPEGTLGHAYATFLRSRGLSPEVFEGAPAGISDPQRSFLTQRMRQTHDLWHVITGCNTDPAGEVALQAFTFAQLHAPGSALLAIAGLLRSIRHNPAIVRDVISFYRAGRRAHGLPSFLWEDHWAKPLSEVRALLGLPAGPLPRVSPAYSWGQ